jgi:DNA-binding CsgD family transcriptional regulator
VPDDVLPPYSDSRRHPEVIAQTRASLRALLARCAGLRRHNRELIKELREQIMDLQAEHSRMSDPPLLASIADPEGELERLRERFGLTGRELEVARLLAAGRRNAAIAAELGISPHTARHHTQHILAKLGVHSRAEAGALLRR